MKKWAKDNERLARGPDTSVMGTGWDAHSEDISDIIDTPPSFLARWGITWMFAVLSAIMALAAFIRYPDLVRAPVRINATNAPKTVMAKLPGNLVATLVTEDDTVTWGQPLAWMESTADHEQVLTLLCRIRGLRDSLLLQANDVYEVMDAPPSLRLGELQGGYQVFYQSYLHYRAAIDDGIYLKQRAYIMKEIANIDQQREQLVRQGKLLQLEYELADNEFDRYNQLFKKRIISPSEYQRQQAALLTKQHPLQQTGSALLDNDAARMVKMKELADLDNQITEEKARFMQALNSLISEAEHWKVQHVLSAPQAGTVVYAGVIQSGQHVNAGQEIFYINPGSTDFFGEMNVPQYNMGKIKLGQEVLVKLDSYPFEEYGVLRGRVGRLNQVPYRDSVFLSRVDFRSPICNESVRLATGMVGTAEIITEDASLLQRLVRNIRLVTERN